MTRLRLASGIVTGLVALWMLSLAIQGYNMYVAPGHVEWPSPAPALGITLVFVLGIGAAKTAVMALTDEPVRTWAQRFAVVVALAAVALAAWAIIVLIFNRPPA